MQGTHRHQLLLEVYAGTLAAVFTVVLSISFGSLLFAGDLISYAPLGLRAALVTAVCASAIVAWRSSYSATVAIPQDRTAPILGLLAAQVAAACGTAEPGEKASAILTALALTSFLTGTVLFIVGWRRMGNLIRFVPYPVIGGFLAGSGWLLAVGAIQVMIGHGIHWNNLGTLFVDGAWSQWLPGLAFGVIAFMAVRHTRRPAVLVGLLVAAVGLFYLTLYLTGTTLPDARRFGWLAALPTGHAVEVVSSPWRTWGHLPWSAILGGAGAAASVLLTSLISILLNATGLELTVHQEVDVNRELRAAGIANVVSGLCGGMVGFQSLSLSRLAHNCGARTRVVGITTAAFCAVMLFLGPEPLSYLPRFVLGGLLLYVGLGFLVEWVWEARLKLPRADYAVVLMILAVMGAAGYLQGVLFGILAAVFLFIHNYSRVAVVTQTLTGADQQSNVERPPTHQRLLRDLGERIQVLRLHGFIFFGTATGLLERIRKRITAPAHPALRFIVLDFRHVSGIDSSAILSLSRVQQLGEKHGFQLVLTQLPETVQDLFARVGFGTIGGHGLSFPDLDHGLGWCEEQLLIEAGVQPTERAGSLSKQLAAIWPDPASVERIIRRLERRDFTAGEMLIRQGDDADAMYFLESGEVTTVLELGQGRVRRLRRHGPGTLFGELGLLLHIKRTASVQGEVSGTVYRLSAESLQHLKQDDPELAARFHEFLVRYLAESLVNTNKLVRALAQ